MLSINLIPADVQLTLRRQCHLRRWTVSFAVAGTAMLVVLGADWARRGKASDLRAQDRQFQTELNTARANLKTITAEASQMLVQIERAKALRAKRAWSGMFALLRDCMPDDCWLISIATDPAKPSARAARPAKSTKPDTEEASRRAVTIDAPRRLRVIGYAPDAAQPHAFVTNLKQTQAFAAVKLESSQRELVLDGSYFRFDLVVEW